MAHKFKVNILSLSGRDITINPEDTSSFLRHDGTFSNPNEGYATTGYVGRFGQIGIFVDNGSSTISTGDKGFFFINHFIGLGGWNIAANASGNLSLDIRTSNYSSYPIFSSITNNNYVLLSGEQKNTGSTTGWNNLINNGDYVKFVVLQISGINSFNLSITGLKYV